MRKIMLIAIALVVMPTGLAQENDEREAVKQAVLDYVEGIYEVDPSRIERSVHPDLAKRGFYRKQADLPYETAAMTFEKLVNLAKNYNKAGKVPKGAPKEVIIYEVLDQTATVKLVAEWGIDYMHLAKYEGKWMIVNVLWQVHPPRKN